MNISSGIIDVPPFGLYQIKQFFADNSRMMIRNLNPFTFIPLALSTAPNLDAFTLSCNIHSCVAFVR